MDEVCFPLIDPSLCSKGFLLLALRSHCIRFLHMVTSSLPDTYGGLPQTARGLFGRFCVSDYVHAVRGMQTTVVTLLAQQMKELYSNRRGFILNTNKWNTVFGSTFQHWWTLSCAIYCKNPNFFRDHSVAQVLGSSHRWTSCKSSPFLQRFYLIFFLLYLSRMPLCTVAFLS